MFLCLSLFSPKKGMILKTMKLKIMTFNICHGADYNRLVKNNTDPNGPICFGYHKSEQLFHTADIQSILEEWNQSVNLKQVADVICQADCDIIGLNEVRGEGVSPYYTNQAEYLAKLCGLHYYFAPAVTFPNEGTYGTALLSRFPIKKGEIIPIPPMEGGENREPRCFLKALVQAECDITIFVSHFGGAKREQELGVDTLLHEMEKVCSPILFLGDLNMTPESDSLARIYTQMEEGFSLENPFTFPSFCPIRKIDYIFASKPVKFMNQTVIKTVVSDHFPLVAQAEFELFSKEETKR